MNKRTPLLILLFTFLHVTYGQICSVSGADQYVISTIAGETRSRPIVLNNASPDPVIISSLVISGASAGRYTMTPPTTPVTINSMESLSIPMTFAPDTIGVKPAQLDITLSNGLNATIFLRGLGYTADYGTSEPSLQWIFDAFQIPNNVQDDDPSNNIINSNQTFWIAKQLGDELPDNALFKAVDPALPIQLTVIAAWGPKPTDGSPVVNWGWYAPGNRDQSTKIFSVANSDPQTLWPTVTGNLNFSVTPADATFGLYSDWPFFGTRKVCTEDALNDWDNGYHHVRTYRYKDRSGNPINNALIIATEEYTADKDFNDVIVIASNLKLASDPAGFGVGVPAPATQLFCWPTVLATSSSSSSTPSSTSTSTSVTEGSTSGSVTGGTSTSTSNGGSTSTSTSSSPATSTTSGSVTRDSSTSQNPTSSSSVAIDESDASHVMISIIAIVALISLTM